MNQGVRGYKEQLTRYASITMHPYLFITHF